MNINISEQKIPIRQNSFGISLDDVNYAFDGGVYAELLENRDFEAQEVTVKDGRYLISAGGNYAWSPVGNCALKVKTDRPLHVENPHYLRIEAAEDGAGAENACYGGAAIEKGREYRLVFSLRSYDCKGSVLVGVYGDAPLFEKKLKLKADGKWHRYSVRLKAKGSGTGHFRIRLLRAGCVHADCFSLMPAYAVLGCFRRDLVEYMSELKPGYLRFAGNCGRGYNRASWKDSVGDPELRRHNWNVWAAHSPLFSHYGKTQGAGILECLSLAEYLRADALPIVDMGSPSDPEDAFEGFVQDTLDLVEFATGAGGIWGKLRAELGHPAPFRLKAVEAGYTAGEQASAVAERFSRFAARIHEVYPDLAVIPPQRPLFLRPAALYHNTTLYDGLPRENAVALTEFAARGAPSTDPSAGNWEGALAEAAFLTGAERNGDIVAMKSYAPFFARAGYVQWSPALVWFDASRSCGSASYHVQKLYGQYTGDFARRAETDEPHTYATASEGEGYLFVKVVNASERELGASVVGENIGSLMRIIRLCAEPEDYNTLDDPARIFPRDVAPVAPRYAVLPPHSFSVLVFRK